MLWSALIFGLLGSLHCIGMCGPIAFMLPVDRSNSLKKILQISSYHLGRLLAYGTIGLLFGILGKSLYIFGLQQRLSIIIGILMIVIILIPARIFNKYNLDKENKITDEKHFHNRRKIMASTLAFPFLMNSNILAASQKKLSFTLPPHCKNDDEQPTPPPSKNGMPINIIVKIDALFQR